VRVNKTDVHRNYPQTPIFSQLELAAQKEPGSLPRGDLRVGTSGWHYQHWRGHLYQVDLPASRFLQRYAEVFSTVELNNSFYRLPSQEAFAAWRTATPDNFLFAVKASRYLTHLKRLREPEEPLDRLLGRARHLEEKLGPILYQLPPRFAPDLPRLERFLDLLPPGFLNVVEFRDRGWFQQSVYDALRARGVALCIYDWGELSSPVEITGRFTYVRFHGPGKSHEGSYPEYDLAVWAERVRAWRGQGLEVFCYFNNDPGGHAVRNALRLRELLRE
jgi:uncharacterized protein YecE (DUF72 family)